MKKSNEEKYRVTVYLKKELVKRLKVFAATNDRTLTDILCESVESFFKKHEK